MDYTCYYVSPNHAGLAVPDVVTARDKCRLLGSVLYEPRTRHGMAMILGAEMDSGKVDVLLNLSLIFCLKSN